MNFLLTNFLLLFQAVSNRTPNNANVAAPVEDYNTFGGSWLWFALAALLVILAFVWAYKKGMLSWLPGFKTSTKHVQTAPPPTPTNEPPTGPRSV